MGYDGPQQRRKLVFAVDSSDQTKVMALSGGGVIYDTARRSKTLVVKNVIINPSEINQEGSIAAEKLKEGLRVFAKRFGADLKLPDDCQ